MIDAESTAQTSLRHEELRGRIRDVATGAITLRDALESDLLLQRAHLRLASYADRLVLVTGSGAHTDLNAIRDVTMGFDGEPIALFVDYVQKVPVFPAIHREGERVGRVIENLKQLALDQKLVVVAIAAADQEGLDARRLHSHHFRGSTALAYEADAIVVLNEKISVVSRAHLAYSPTRAEEFDRQVVFSVEKNRNGSADVDVEFEKDFPHYRFHPVAAGSPSASGPKGPTSCERETFRAADPGGGGAGIRRSFDGRRRYRPRLGHRGVRPLGRSPHRLRVGPQPLHRSLVTRDA
jgi:hypothetical protein